MLLYYVYKVIMLFNSFDNNNNNNNININSNNNKSTVNSRYLEVQGTF